jgi:hypothetical protein
MWEISKQGLSYVEYLSISNSSKRANIIGFDYELTDLIGTIEVLI